MATPLEERSEPAHDTALRRPEPRRLTAGGPRVAHRRGAEQSERVEGGRRVRFDPGLECDPLAAAELDCGRPAGAALGRAVRLDRRVEAGDRALLARHRQLQPCIHAQDRRRDDVEPHRPAIDDLVPVASEQPLDLVPGLRTAVRVERVRQHRLGFEQLACTTEPVSCVALAQPLDERRLQLRAQRLVVAVGAVVELVGEELPLFELAQQASRAGSSEQVVAELARERRQHARVDEEVAQLGFEAFQDVAREVLARNAPALAERVEDAPPLGCGPPLRCEVE